MLSFTDIFLMKPHNMFYFFHFPKPIYFHISFVHFPIFPFTFLFAFQPCYANDGSHSVFHRFQKLNKLFVS